ncbi:MAG: class I SAM-dependent methyltransferase [Acidobacteriota bacterium]|nr:class I SAM-dependent methyltransferase [Acidobacteriota bacterium]
MKTGRASRTALRVAIRRAAHQLMDEPRVLDDPIVLQLLGAGYVNDLERASHKVARNFRAFMAVRSRFAEDLLAESVAKGVTQYVVLGAGLDTFAYRNPHAGLRVFEVDFPATQEWKRGMLAEARIAEPKNLTFIALDFEHHTLAEGLTEAGFDFARPAFFGWLGVVPYLTLEAIRATLATIAALPAGTGVCFDYGLDPGSLNPLQKMAFDALSRRVAAAGEPFRTFFTPETLEALLRETGFTRVEHCDAEALNSLYFEGRADNLKLSKGAIGQMVAAWVE